jgi:hypothetical protein
LEAVSNAFKVAWDEVKVDNTKTKLLGKGAFGEVWSGTCPNRNGDIVSVAIKIPVDVSHADVEKQKRDFWREICHWALLPEHPNGESLE